MGAGLVKAAFVAADARGMREHAPMRLYTYMAVTALDSAAQPVFYGGQDSLALALAVPRNESGHRAVMRALRKLTEGRFLAVDVKGAPGRTARYRLLDGNGAALTAAKVLPGTGDAERQASSDTGDAERPEQVTFSNGTPDAERPEQVTLSVALRSSEEAIKEEGEEERASATPPRTCKKHSHWDHNEPCRACGADRKAAEAADTSLFQDGKLKRSAVARNLERYRAEYGPNATLDCFLGVHARLTDGTCRHCTHREKPKIAKNDEWMYR